MRDIRCPSLVKDCYWIKCGANIRANVKKSRKSHNGEVNTTRITHLRLMNVSVTRLLKLDESGLALNAKRIEAPMAMLVNPTRRTIPSSHCPEPAPQGAKLIKRMIKPIAKKTAAESALMIHRLPSADFEFGLPSLIDLWQADHEDAVLFTSFGQVHVYFFGEEDGAGK